jgi:hypothetical protein
MKYHIFIGSTLDDLKNERKELQRVIMELGHIPVSAECLNQDEKSYGQLLIKNIEDCDYFIAIVAHKYAPANEETSALETEYNIAIKRNIPVISLIIDEKARWKAAKKEKDAVLIKKTGDLKEKLRQGPNETWLNSTDLCQKFQSLLILQMNINPQNGWIRSNQVITPAVVNELSRLSAENEELKRQIKAEDNEFTAMTREQMKKALKVLAVNKAIISFYYIDGDNWENSRQFRYLRIFKLLVPEMAVGKTTSEISRFLGTVLNPDLDKIIRKDFPAPSNSIKKIMADFSLLKLVRCVNHDDESGEGEIWEVTEYGKELYSAYRMKQLEKPVSDGAIRETHFQNICIKQPEKTMSDKE